MLNLLLILLPIAVYLSPDIVMGFRIEFYFYHSVFMVLAILRYKFNRSKSLLYLGILGVLLMEFYRPGIFPFANFQQVLLYQVFILVISSYYTFRKKLWRKDFIFAIMEPAFVALFGIYFIYVSFPGLLDISPLAFMFSGMVRWAFVYGIVQLLLVVSKLVVGFKYALELDSNQPRFKLLAYCLPKIEASFGINDLAFVSGSRFVPSTVDGRALKQFSTMATRINSLAKHGVPSAGEGKKANRKKSNYR